MKPKTKNQKRVVIANRSLRKNLYVKIQKWAISHLDKHCIRYKSGKLHCLDCGHKWQSKVKQGWHDEVVGIKCPSCKTELKVSNTNTRSKVDSFYFQVVEVAEEYQVIRTFYIGCNYTVGKPKEVDIRECSRMFINEKGKAEAYAKVRGGGFYHQNDHWYGDYEIRSNHEKYDISPYCVYPEYKLQDFIVKRGIDAYTMEEAKLRPYYIISNVLNSSHAETLWKLGWKRAFQYYADRSYGRVEKYWNSIKICIRNNYRPSNFGDYMDMLSSLEYLNKDLRSPKYVCPDNFEEAHDYWVNKERKVKSDIRNEEQRIAMLKHNLKYIKHIEKFKDIKFQSGDITIVPISSLDQLKFIADKHKHCVFSERYWNKNNLLLEAFVGKKPVETIQIRLQDLKIIQARGLQNKPSKYNKLVVGLVKIGMPYVKKALKPKPKRKLQKQVA